MKLQWSGKTFRRLFLANEAARGAGEPVGWKVKRARVHADEHGLPIGRADAPLGEDGEDRLDLQVAAEHRRSVLLDEPGALSPGGLEERAPRRGAEREDREERGEPQGTGRPREQPHEEPAPPDRLAPGLELGLHRATLLGKRGPGLPVLGDLAVRKDTGGPGAQPDANAPKGQEEQ